MENFSPELYSYKNISVINPFRIPDITEKPSPNPVVDSVIFYPESGNIIAGAENVIGFRCFGVNMNPVKITGAIIDSSNNIICYVRSDDDGYGLFRLNTPVNRKLYFNPAYGNLTSRRFELPPANDSGVALSITEGREQNIFRVKVIRSHDFNITDRDYHLVYSPVSLAPFILNIDPLTDGEISLNRNSLPAGLASITITDDLGVRYAERWVYNNQKQALSLNVKPDKQFYSVREKVKIDITAADNSGNPVESDLIVSAVRRFTLPEIRNNPEADLQVAGLPAVNNKSGISGINDQLIFLQNADDLTATFADRQVPDYLPEPDGHLISGIIINTVSREPLKNANIVLSFVGKTALCRFTQTDEDGRFVFVSLEEGIREIVIQPLSPDLDEYYVELDNPFPEAFSKSFSRTFSIDTVMLRMINSAVISMQIKRIYDPFMPEKPVLPEKTLIKDFYGPPEYTTQMSQFIQLTSTREAIKEIVPWAITTTRKGKTVISAVHKYNYQIETKDPLVIVDGVPVFNHEKVLNIPVDRIEKIDVIHSDYYVSGIALGGIIDITTYDGNLSMIEFDKPVFRQEFEALQSGSDFSSPDYADISQKESRIPDFRNTLYWNPDVRTDGNGRASVEFYTSDEPGDYILLVEGYTTDGQRGSSTLLLSVIGKKEAD
jgi:hypothetical protein